MPSHQMVASFPHIRTSAMIIGYINIHIDVSSNTYDISSNMLIRVCLHNVHYHLLCYTLDWAITKESQ